MRLVRGGHDDVLPGAQAEALGHLAQVDVGLAAGFGGVEEEEVLLHVLLVPVHLGIITRGEGQQQKHEVMMIENGNMDMKTGCGV